MKSIVDSCCRSRYVSSFSSLPDKLGETYYPAIRPVSTKFGLPAKLGETCSSGWLVLAAILGWCSPFPDAPAKLGETYSSERLVLAAILGWCSPFSDAPAKLGETHYPAIWPVSPISSLPTKLGETLAPQPCITRLSPQVSPGPVRSTGTSVRRQASPLPSWSGPG